MGENEKARGRTVAKTHERSFKVNVSYLYFQLEGHVRDECPLTEVQCEFKNLGCEAVV